MAARPRADSRRAYAGARCPGAERESAAPGSSLLGLKRMPNSRDSG